MTAYEQGYDAYDKGYFPWDCPFEAGTHAYNEWMNGWEDADDHENGVGLA